MTLGQQATLALIGVFLGQFAAVRILLYCSPMAKYKPALETALYAALGAALPMIPDLLADEPTITPRAVARAAVSAFCTAVVFWLRSPRQNDEAGK
jgi:hypothetical protein